MGAQNIVSPAATAALATASTREEFRTARAFTFPHYFIGARETGLGDVIIAEAARRAPALPNGRKLHLYVWAACEKCGKWRRLPPGHAPASEEAWWEFSSCLLSKPPGAAANAIVWLTGEWAVG